MGMMEMQFLIKYEKIISKIAILAAILIIGYCIYEIYTISNTQWVETEATITHAEIEEHYERRVGYNYKGVLDIVYSDESGNIYNGRAVSKSKTIEDAERNYGIGEKITIYYNEDKPVVMRDNVITVGYYIIILVIFGIALFSYIWYRN